MGISLLPRSLATLVAAVAVVLPVAGCGASSSSAGGDAAADPATLLPASAPVYVEAKVQPTGDLKANAEAVGRKLLRTSDPGAAIVALVDRGLRPEGASYARDVAPWLGQRAGLAVTGGGAGEAHRPDVVMAIASRDDDAAQRFVDGRPGAVTRSYRGVSYRLQARRDTAAAVVDHLVLVGTERGLRSAIDARSGATLAGSGEFKRARATVGDDGIGFLYADPARLMDLVAAAAPKGASGMQLQAVKGLLAGSGVRSVAASLQVARDALRVQGAAIGRAGAPVTARGDGPGAMAAAPAGSWLSIGVGDVGGAVTRALAGAGRGGGIGGLDPGILLQGLKSQLGLDVQKDLLSWMGDATLYVRGTTRHDVGGALVVRSKDPAASRRAIGELRRLLSTFGTDPGPLRGAGSSGAVGFSLKAGRLPGRVQVAARGDRFVVAYGHDALADALSGGPRLGDTAPYKAAAGLLGGVRPSLFLDTPKVVRLLSSVAGNDLGFRKAKPTLDAFGPAAAGVRRERDVTRLEAAVAVP